MWERGAVRVPDDFKTIKQALKNVTEGHILHVYPGPCPRQTRPPSDASSASHARREIALSRSAWSSTAGAR